MNDSELKQTRPEDTPVKEPVKAPKQPEKAHVLTEAERQRRKKMLVYPAMGLIFAGSMWLIFKPSSAERDKQGLEDGFNLEMPAPDDAGIIGDKQKVYELAGMEQRRQERERSMRDLGDLFDAGDPAEPETEEYDLLNPAAGEPQQYEREYGTRQEIHASAAAYRDLNRTLGNFYTAPEEDAEKEEMKERIGELERQLARQQEPAGTSLDDQMALMEKSYELAARYLPTQGGTVPSDCPTADDAAEEASGSTHADDRAAVAVRQVATQVVSALAQPVSDEEFLAAHAQPRNYAFRTAIGGTTVQAKNTIAACIYGAQTVTDGQAVRLRLLEPIAVADRLVPRNSLLAGVARIQGERLDILIASIEHEGTIMPVKLSVYDTDGQQGIFIPGSMEMNAAKEVAANMGASLGSSINLSTDAGAQLASDLGRGVLQGASQYIARKVRTVKVHLKAGYRVMLCVDKD